MGARADNDLWGQALAFECQYGDRATEVIASKIEKLRQAGEMTEADFLSQVADCLNDLHAIRYPGSASPKMAAHIIAQKGSGASSRT